MISTDRTTIRTRVSQCLAATALAASIAFGATPIASAAPASEWDIGKYDKCMAESPTSPAVCCQISGGVWSDNDSIPLENRCGAPAPLQNDPRQTGTPPVLQPGGTVTPPVITVAPRGPNSGNLG